MASFNKGKAMQGIGSGLQAFGTISQFNDQIINLNSQLNTLSLQQGELNRKHEVQKRLLRRQAESAKSNRVEAVTKAGVKMEGSALDVVSDVYFDMLEAETEMNRSNAIANEDLEVGRANLQSRRASLGQNLALELGIQAAKSYFTMGMG